MLDKDMFAKVLKKVMHGTTFHGGLLQKISSSLLAKKQAGFQKEEKICLYSWNK